MSDEIVKAPSTEQVLNQALQAHLQALAQKPITAASLVELQKTSVLARKLLEMQQPKDKLMRRLANPNMGGQFISGLNYNSDFDPELVDDGGTYAALSPAPPIETFGASAIREMVSALKSQNKPRVHLDELMQALDTAKASNNTKLVDKIQARIERMLEDLGDDGEDKDIPSPLGTCTYHDCIAPAAVGGVKGNLCLEHYDEAAVSQPEGVQCDHEGCTEKAFSTNDKGTFCTEHLETTS